MHWKEEIGEQWIILSILSSYICVANLAFVPPSMGHDKHKCYNLRTLNTTFSQPFSSNNLYFRFWIYDKQKGVKLCE